MTLQFASPALLPWLALAALPVVAHLLVKARPPVFRFGSLRFVRSVARANLRLRKPWDWVLLAVRTVLILLLLLLFCRPRLFHGPLPTPGARRTVVLVVDASASMNAVERSRTRFSTACAEAAGVLTGLRAGDQADLVWLRRGSPAELPVPGPNLAYLAERLNRAEGTQEAASAAEGIAQALRLLAEAAGDREVCLVSDFQTTAWAGLRPVIPAGVRVTVLPVAQAEVGNLAITSLLCRGGQAVAGLPTFFDCEVANFSASPQATVITLAVGEFRESRDLQLAPGENRRVSFTCTFAEAGPVTATAALAADRFPADDRRLLLCEVVPRLTVSLAVAEPELRAAWERVLRALPWVEIGPDASASLHVGTPPATGEASVGLWLTDLTVQAAAHGGPWSLRVPEQGVYAEVFAGNAHGDPTMVTCRRRATTMPAGEVLLAYADGVPAVSLAEHTLSWNLPVDPTGGDLPSHGEVLLPLVGEALLALNQQGRVLALARTPGDRLLLPGYVPGEDETVWLEDDGGQRLGTADDPAGVLVCRPGLYTWRQGQRVLRREMVNFPAIESDLRTLPDPQATLAADAAAGSAVALTTARDGVALWPYLATLAVILVLAEAMLLLFLRRLDDRQQGTGPAEGGV